MDPLLDVICEYRTLRERQRLGARIALSDAEIRTLRLRVLYGDDSPEGPTLDEDPKRFHPRHAIARDIGILHRGRFDTGRSNDISGDGIGLELTGESPSGKLHPGTPVELLVAESRCAMDYVFPGVVVWTRGARLGVRFDGFPSRASWVRICSS